MIRVQLLLDPPHPDCDEGSWYRYDVVTQSGRNTATGYTRGPKQSAYAVARKVLLRIEMYEGPRRAWEQFSLSLQRQQPLRHGTLNRHQRKRLARAT